MSACFYVGVKGDPVSQCCVCLFLCWGEEGGGGGGGLTLLCLPVSMLG